MKQHQLIDVEGIQLLFMEFDETENDIRVHESKIDLTNLLSTNYDIYFFNDSPLKQQLIDSASKNFKSCWQPYLRTESQHFYLIPLPFLNVPTTWVLYETTTKSKVVEDFFTKKIHLELMAIVQGFMHRYINVQLIDRIKFTEEKEVKNIAKSFAKELANILLCRSFKVGIADEEQRCSYFKESYLRLSLNLDSINAYFQLSHCCSPYSDYLFETQLELVQNFLNNEYFQILERWRLSQSRQILSEDALMTYINHLRAHDQNLMELIEHHKKSEKRINFLEALLVKDGFQPTVNFEFYKGTTGWHIRYAGEIVKLARNFDTGLTYIHTLLNNPNQHYYANQLEIIKKGGKKDQPILVNLSNSFSIELDIHFTKNSPVTETDLLASIKRLSRNRPSDENMEDLIYYLSEMFYQAYCLKELNFKSEYLKLYENYKKELDEYIFILKQESSDNSFVEKVLKKSGVIKRRPRVNRQLNLLRDRVVKSMKNAVGSMNSSLLKDHFDKSLILATKSVYAPSPSEKIDWKLTID